MTNDPTPLTTADPMSLDPVRSTRSLAEFAATSAANPQRAATSLDVARHHAFTGEVTFFVDPLVRVYLDGGVVYFAEVVGGQTISELLLAAGVVDARQLEHGVVRVGDVEHLGRLFDRDDTVDRDAAMVVVERHVDELVNQLAERAVSTISISAYRHHASGVHRWFVAPIDAASTSRPVSDVAQIDRSVVDDLPSLDPVASDVRIEWTDDAPTAAPAPQPTPAEVQAEVDGFDADVADWAADTPTAEPIDAVEGPTVDDSPARPAEAPLADFHIVWPDGTQDPGLVPAADEPAEKGSINLDITPTPVEEFPAPDAAIPDDVAAAVKRALQAIDEASAQPIEIPELELSPILLPQIDDQPAAPPPVATPTAAPEQPASAAFAGFAPPTVDMSAEVIYQRQAAEMATQMPDAAAPTDADAAHVTVEPVPTVDEPRLPEPETPAPATDANERRGALRRLIGSLRNHDRTHDDG